MKTVLTLQSSELMCREDKTMLVYFGILAVAFIVLLITGDKIISSGITGVSVGYLIGRL